MPDELKLLASEEAALVQLEAAFGVAPKRKAAGPSVDATTLLATIVARPDNDDATPIYADVVSEQGDERGEFIVLQVERAAGRGTPERADLEREKYTRTDDQTICALFDGGRAGWLRRRIPDGHGAREARFGVRHRRARMGDRSANYANCESAGQGDGAIPQSRRAPESPRGGHAARAAFRSSRGPPSCRGRTCNSSIMDSVAHIERLPNLTHLAIAEYTNDPELDLAILAAAPNLVELRLPHREMDLRPEHLVHNAKLRFVQFGQRISPQVLTGLRLEEIEIWADSEHLGDWLAAFAGAAVKAHVFAVDIPRFVAAFDKYPALESFSSGCGARAIRHSCSNAGMARSPRRSNPAYSFLRIYPNRARRSRPSAKVGIRTLKLYPGQPRHEAAPMEEAELALYRAAWGGDGLEFPELLRA